MYVCIYIYIYMSGSAITYTATGPFCSNKVERRTYGYKVLVGKPEGRRPLGSPRRRCEDNIKREHQEVGWGHGVD